MSELIRGHATVEGTRAFERRWARLAARGHFRDFGGLRCSSIGVGTYLGRDDDATDASYTESVLSSLESGINVIDTAINYRSQRSERAVGAALFRAIRRDGWLAREELIIATKAGFIPFDGARPPNARAYFEDTYVRPGVLRWDEVVSGCHCIAPRFLADQLERSRRNLGLETIDLFYLHNPEMQLDEVPRADFNARVRAAFVFLEEARARGLIRAYGTATWGGFRAPGSEPGRLDLSELVGLAREAGGAGHGFRAIQLPFNASMPEALTRATQHLPGGPRSILDVAAPEVYVMVSAPVLQGKLARGMPAAIRSKVPLLATDAQRAIQIARSGPGIGTALVGMKTPEHVEENVVVATVDPLPDHLVRALF